MDIYQDIVYKLHIENNSDRKQFMYKRLCLFLLHQYCPCWRCPAESLRSQRGPLPRQCHKQSSSIFPRLKVYQQFISSACKHQSTKYSKTYCFNTIHSQKQITNRFALHGSTCSTCFVVGYIMQFVYIMLRAYTYTLNHSNNNTQSLFKTYSYLVCFSLLHLSLIAGYLGYIGWL